MFEKLEQYFRDRTIIDEPTLRHICSYFTLIKTKRNEILLKQGDICKYYYFVNEGCLRLFTTTDDGIETTRYFAFEGAFGTALPSLIEQTPAFEFVQTIEKSKILKVSRDNFFNLVDTVPQFAKVYRQILERGFITAQKRIYGFQGFDALAKVKWVMQYQPDFLVRVSNKMAASYPGITPSTLSRLKSQL
ncbi:Crp/Fnr family transcriptional regulator [Flavipsychrobacter stenotrophus]|uniref:Crp/Fnr family transcriptional regulator n=1 Tax=Flavipsychrobacter stenotrophus TaxID=2077091 RepID=A0A2S7SS27_9BACT|nr:Crp/Fnr family transcriptional regulator [Flavipsychrobacter stenotrophus]PQJ09719.1 Crp/Fnr family transcriptional regulator [Flavipsychrobacter stenotrophus]